MKAQKLLITSAIAAVLTLNARADFLDNFDSYANQAAFNAVWTADTGGTVLALTPGTFVSSPNAIAQSTTASARVYHPITGIVGDSLDFSFQFDYTGNGTRDFAQVYSRAGSAWTSGLNGALSFGTFNTTAATKYAARFTSATPANGAIFGDGATILSTSDTTGWFSLNITRAVGWHFMEVKGAVDPNHSGKAIYDFYVDGVLGGSIANAPDSTFNFAVIGGANSSGSGAAANVAYYDDYSVTTIVPEPSSLGLCCLGGLALAAFRVLRRRV